MISLRSQGNEALKEHFECLLQVRILSQPIKRAKGDPPKLYCVHAQEAECIAKGKAHKPCEFGVKIYIVSTNKESFVIGAKLLQGNSYGGHMRHIQLAAFKSLPA